MPKYFLCNESRPCGRFSEASYRKRLNPKMIDSNSDSHIRNILSKKMYSSSVHFNQFDGRKLKFLSLFDATFLPCFNKLFSLFPAYSGIHQNSQVTRWYFYAVLCEIINIITC